MVYGGGVFGSSSFGGITGQVTPYVYSVTNPIYSTITMSNIYTSTITMSNIYTSTITMSNIYTSNIVIG